MSLLVASDSSSSSPSSSCGWWWCGRRYWWRGCGWSSQEEEEQEEADGCRLQPHQENYKQCKSSSCPTRKRNQRKNHPHQHHHKEKSRSEYCVSSWWYDSKWWWWWWWLLSLSWRLPQQAVLLLIYQKQQPQPQLPWSYLCPRQMVHCLLRRVKQRHVGMDCILSRFRFLRSSWGDQQKQQQQQKQQPQQQQQVSKQKQQKQQQQQQQSWFDWSPVMKILSKQKEKKLTREQQKQEQQHKRIQSLRQKMQQQQAQPPVSDHSLLLRRKSPLGVAKDKRGYDSGGAETVVETDNAPSNLTPKTSSKNTRTNLSHSSQATTTSTQTQSQAAQHPRRNLQKRNKNSRLQVCTSDANQNTIHSPIGLSTTTTTTTNHEEYPLQQQQQDEEDNLAATTRYLQSDSNGAKDDDSTTSRPSRTAAATENKSNDSLDEEQDDDDDGDNDDDDDDDDSTMTSSARREDMVRTTTLCLQDLYPIEEGIWARFGPGADVWQLVLSGKQQLQQHQQHVTNATSSSSSSSTSTTTTTNVVFSNLPAGTKDSHVQSRLKEFSPHIIQIQSIPKQKNSTHNHCRGSVTASPSTSTTTAIVTFDDATVAFSAADQWQGCSVRDWMLWTNKNSMNSKRRGVGNSSNAAASAVTTGETTRNDPTHHHHVRQEYLTVSVQYHHDPNSASVVVGQASKFRSVTSSGNSNKGGIVDRPSGNAIAVKVHWYAPSKSAWIQTTCEEQAVAMVQIFHKQRFCDRILEVEQQQVVGLDLFTSYSSMSTVWIGNLAPALTAGKFRAFLQRRMPCLEIVSLTLGTTPFEESEGPRIVQKLLRRRGGGPLTSFQVFGNNENENANEMDSTALPSLKRRALAKFAFEKHALRALQYFEKHEQVCELGGSRLFLQRLFTLQYKFPQGLFYAVLYQPIRALLNEQKNDHASLRWDVYSNNNNNNNHHHRHDDDRQDKGLVTTTVTLAVKAHNRVALDAVRMRLDSLTRGDVVRETTGAALWTADMAFPEFRMQLLKWLQDNHDDSAHVANAISALDGMWCDQRRHQVRVFGKTEERKLATKWIHAFVSNRRPSEGTTQTTHKILLSASKEGECLLQWFKDNPDRRSEIIDRLALVIPSAPKLLLHEDVDNNGEPCLVVHGTSKDAQRVGLYISKLAKRKATNTVMASAAECPVCLCVPGSSYCDSDETTQPQTLHSDLSSRLLCMASSTVTLSACQHVYCKDCLERWLLDGGASCCSRQYPLKCLASGCSKPVALTDLVRHFLDDRERLLTVLRSAVDQYVRQRPDRFQFCISPTCPGIYEIHPPNNNNNNCRGATAALQQQQQQRISTCSTCCTEICTRCHASHGDLSCKEYKVRCLPPDQLRLKIVTDILTLSCPRCHQAFLDFDGCFALSCSVCPCHFCGWCLADCGGNAHAHVASCPHKPATAAALDSAADPYFGTREGFVAAQTKLKRQKLIAFLKTISYEKRLITLELLKKDLHDLNIPIDLREIQ